MPPRGSRRTGAQTTSRAALSGDVAGGTHTTPRAARGTPFLPDAARGLTGQRRRPSGRAKSAKQPAIAIASIAPRESPSATEPSTTALPRVMAATAANATPARSGVGNMPRTGTAGVRPRAMRSVRAAGASTGSGATAASAESGDEPARQQRSLRDRLRQLRRNHHGGRDERDASRRCASSSDAWSLRPNSRGTSASTPATNATCAPIMIVSPPAATTAPRTPKMSRRAH